MYLNKQTVMSYENFNSLSNDIIELAKEILPDKIIYINFLNNNVQVTMKVSDHETEVKVFEGETIPVDEALYNQIDYENGKPLILNDAKLNNFDMKVNETIKKGNLGSYVGIPILYKEGTRFGALCAAHHDKSDFNEKDIELLQKIAKLFSYYLELEHIAYRDLLTELENTKFLLLYHDEILANGGLALMLDLDRFKLVNDTFGHHVGDLVLKEAGRKLRGCGEQFSECYTIRLGGDEFFIYIKDNLEEERIFKFLNGLLKTLEIGKLQLMI